MPYKALEIDYFCLMKKEEKVILIDNSDHPIGVMSKMEAHRKGLLHRAFSVFIFNNEGRLMMQRRASGKYHSGGLWTNTVCSHPRPGEETIEAAERRLQEEMGFATELREIFHFIYKAELDRGLTEHELDHVFIGKFDGEPQLNPKEADAYEYMYLSEIKEDIKKNPEKYTAWFKIIFNESYEVLVREAGKMFMDKPLIFDPHFEEKIWGGNRLKTFFGKQIPSDKTGESWEVSAVEQKESRVRNGFFKGMDMRFLWKVLDGEFWGEVELEKDFPLLVKYIDAQDDLSVQVHPDDKMAREERQSYGKNETWYILAAEPGSKLYLGFKPGITREDYIKSLKEAGVESILNAIEVKPGDWYYIPAGTVHAIGAGILLAEIQQSSDITYRIYDYNRKDDKGKPRELHVEKALRAINFQAGPLKINKHILETPFFIVKRIPLRSLFGMKTKKFLIVLNAFGHKIKINGIEADHGDTLMIFAGQTITFEANNEWEILTAELPSQ